MKISPCTNRISSHLAHSACDCSIYRSDFTTVTPASTAASTARSNASQHDRFVNGLFLVKLDIRITVYKNYHNFLEEIDIPLLFIDVPVFI